MFVWSTELACLKTTGMMIIIMIHNYLILKLRSDIVIFHSSTNPVDSDKDGMALMAFYQLCSYN